MVGHDDGYYGKVIPRYDLKDCSYESPWEPILDAKFKGVGEKFKMNKMIGVKSGVDWSKAPEGTTHYKHNLFYRQHAGVWECHNDYWLKSSNVDSWFNDAVSKEEDLGMDKKEVKSVSDLTVGMFVRTPYVRDPYLICDIHGDQVDTILIDHDMFTYRNSPVTAFESWSYTYSGEYTPIVKETEAEIKIKELEATIALAQKQLQEYKGMK